MEIQQKKRSPVLFILLIVAFVIVRVIEAITGWIDYFTRIDINLLYRSGNTLNELLVALSRIGYSIGFRRFGLIWAVFPLMAIAFRREKVFSIVCSAINLLATVVSIVLILFNIMTFSIFPLLSASCQVIYAVVAVFILLNSLGVFKNRNVLATICFVVGGLCILIFIVLLIYGLNSLSDFDPYGVYRIWVYFLSDYPLSRAILLFAFGAVALYAPDAKPQTLCYTAGDRQQNPALYAPDAQPQPRMAEEAVQAENSSKQGETPKAFSAQTEGNPTLTQKKKRSPVAFILLIVAFVIANMMDGLPMWDQLLHRIGYSDLLDHLIWELYISCSLSRQWTRILYSVAICIPGILCAVFPLLAIVFRRKKVFAIVFSGINLVLAVVLAVLAFQAFWLPLALCWVMYAIAAVLILLGALGVLTNRKVLATIYFAMGGVSIVLFAVFLLFRLYSYYAEAYFIGGIDEFLSFAEFLHQRLIYNPWYLRIYQLYGVDEYWLAAMFYPLSRAILYFAFGAGALYAPDAKPQPRTAEEAVQS
ncbi:MAG: hypothetical protein ACI4MG_10485 [Aristaeellaceae bacterium]